MSDESDWDVGDRVFAPWERQWLYPGRVLYIDYDEDAGSVAFVKFDDGDRAILPLSALRSVAIRPGSLVFAQIDTPRYKPAIVLGVSDDGLRLRFTDDNREAVAPIERCRLLDLGPDDE